MRPSLPVRHRPRRNQHCRPTLPNPAQTDSDGDGIGNGCDPDPGDGPTGDLDHDGAPNNTDNCPTTRNADQRDTCRDEIGDVCDPSSGDVDLDGVVDVADNCPVFDSLYPGQGDRDGDGVGELCDQYLAFPLAAWQLSFSGGDLGAGGTPDATDNCPLRSFVSQLDSDADGLGDACDPFTGRPTPPGKYDEDLDNDGIINGLDGDADGDDIPSSEHALAM